MADPKQVKEITRVLFLCFFWYIISSSNNVVGKTLLTDFPYPVSVTMVQLISITLYSGPFFSLWGIRRFVDISWKYYFQMIIPLALGKFFSSVSSHVSIWKVSVSYAHTVKATMPLFTVVLSRIILREKQTTKVYLSLVPIICGVMIATVTELSFDLLGLISALIATMGFSLQNIFSKKVLRETSIHHLHLLHLLAKLALFMFLPVWFIFDFRKIIKDETWINSGNVFQSCVLLFFDGLLNFAQNVVAFSILNLVSPLTYSVANAAKRISVITVSLILLKNPVTLPNVCGMAIAIVGVFFYNKAKYDANLAKQRSILPMTNNQNSHSSLLDGNDKLMNSTPYLHKPLRQETVLQNGTIYPQYLNLNLQLS